ncbi:MAG: hypothetical protein AB7O60_13185 [Variibacter sp.]
MSRKAIFMVRSVVSDESLRGKFDRWYATEHLPDAVKAFGADGASRAWSTTDPAAHYAFYEFASMEKLKAAVESDALKDLIAEYDRVWPNGVTRSREILEAAE